MVEVIAWIEKETYPASSAIEERTRNEQESGSSLLLGSLYSA
jgi:hypothetical protein